LNNHEGREGYEEHECVFPFFVIVVTFVHFVVDNR